MRLQLGFQVLQPGAREQAPEASLASFMRAYRLPRDQRIRHEHHGEVAERVEIGEVGDGARSPARRVRRR